MDMDLDVSLDERIQKKHHQKESGRFQSRGGAGGGARIGGAQRRQRNNNKEQPSPYFQRPSRPAINLDKDSWDLGRQASGRGAGRGGGRGAGRGGGDASNLVITKQVQASTRPSVFSRINQITSGHGSRQQPTASSARNTSNTILQVGGSRIPVGGMVSDRLDSSSIASRLSAGVLPTARGETVVRLSNLHWDVSAEDLEHFLAEFGPLKKCRISYDRSGRSEGKAEVIFATEQKAMAAVKRHHGAMLDGLMLEMSIVGGANSGKVKGSGGIVGAAASTPALSITAPNPLATKQQTFSNARPSILSRLSYLPENNKPSSQPVFRVVLP